MTTVWVMDYGLRLHPNGVEVSRPDSQCYQLDDDMKGAAVLVYWIGGRHALILASVDYLSSVIEVE